MMCYIHVAAALLLPNLRNGSMDEADTYSPPGLPLPTVAHDRGHGITSLRVYCAAGLVCPHSRVFTFDQLQLTDDMTMIHIPRYRRFVCTQCGSLKVTIR